MEAKLVRDEARLESGAYRKVWCSTHLASASAMESRASMTQRCFGILSTWKDKPIGDGDCLESS